MYMVQERERTVGNRTVAGTFPRSVRVRQETVRLRVQERTISKRNSMECTTLFAEALLLMPELIEPRNIFMAVLAQILQQNVLDEERLEFRERVRMFTEISHREEVQTTATASGLVRPVSENRNVFLYGSDPQTIRLVVEDVFKTVLPSSNVDLITLNGVILGTITHSTLRAVLFEEYHRLRSPQRVIVLLEEFSSTMFVNFQRSGFVNENRVRGIRVNTVRWSSKCTDRPNNVASMDEAIYVPKKKLLLQSLSTDEAAASTSDSDMVLHKRDVVDNHGSGTTPRRSDSTRNRPAEKLTGRYVELQHTTNSNGSTRASGAGDSRPLEATQKRPEGNYIDMQPVTVKDNVRAPCEKGTNAKIQPKVAWSAKNSDTVKIENIPEHLDDDDKEEGLCTKFLSCLVALYAMILD